MQCRSSSLLWLSESNVPDFGSSFVSSSQTALSASGPTGVQAACIVTVGDLAKGGGSY